MRCAGCGQVSWRFCSCADGPRYIPYGEDWSAWVVMAGSIVAHYLVGGEICSNCDRCLPETFRVLSRRPKFLTRQTWEEEGGRRPKYRPCISASDRADGERAETWVTLP